MKPLRNYILVAEAKVENKTASGLILTTDVETGSKPGYVLAVGPDSIYVRKGDKVAFNWAKGLPITVEGNKGVLVCEDDILGIY